MGTLQRIGVKNTNPKASSKLKQGNAAIGGNSAAGGKAPKASTAKVMKKQPQAIKKPVIAGQK